MARNKKTDVVEDARPAEKSLEQRRREHYDREVAAYEERTGTKVNFYLPVAAEEVSSDEGSDAGVSDDENTESPEGT